MELNEIALWIQEHNSMMQVQFPIVQNLLPEICTAQQILLERKLLPEIRIAQQVNLTSNLLSQVSILQTVIKQATVALVVNSVNVRQFLR